jgi:hypothetical protein
MSIPSFDFLNGAFSLPWWGAGLAVVLLLVLLALATVRTSLVGSIALASRVAIVVLVAWGAWLWADRSAQHDRAEERRALQARALELATRAASPASPLACLDPSAGEFVENSCERAIFARPETVAAAAAHINERLALLTEVLDFTARTKSSEDEVVPGLRPLLERDRYGIVAQVLAARDGCTPEGCDALYLFRDPSRITANLKDRTFEALVARYSARWPGLASEAEGPSASVPVVPPTTGTIGTPPGISPVPPGFNVPSAASIPPVSIMTPEPTTTSPAAESSPAVAPSPPERRRTTRAPSPRPAQAPPPVQISPPIASGGAAPRAQ